MTKVQKRLFEVADKQYALFQAKLIPIFRRRGL